jgi:single-stranded-DNA-specific exonuclease
VKVKQWIIAEPVSEEVRAAFPEMSAVALQLLRDRGLKSQKEFDVFLGPDWSRDVHSPWLFLHMREAVDCVFAALAAGEGIAVHGDYDADGVCGSAVLLSTLRDICRAFGYDEKKLASYIPDREKEGYGVSVATMEHLAEHDKAKLVITVDCGISNGPAIARGRELGVTTIVCDHHTMPEILPVEAILIHPLVPGETYPNKSLCGTGVAFKLACGLLDEARNRLAGEGGGPGSLAPGARGRRQSGPSEDARVAHSRGPTSQSIPEGYEKWLLDLVAVATVTDVMPLLGENRVLELFGLVVLNKSRRPGIRALVEAAGAKWGEIDTYTIGFQLGPRINAAGRMEHASAALNLLLEEDTSHAAALAQALNDANTARQKASEQMYKEARELVGDPGTRSIVVLAKEGWPAGLVGLVAGKLVNDFARPVYVAGSEHGKFVGSGRSIEGFDVTACVRAAAEHLDKFGGHPQACGFSVTGEDKFYRAVLAMEAYATEQLKDRVFQPTQRIDAVVTLKDIDWHLNDVVAQLAPFGEKNPKPVFAALGAEVVGCSTVGADGKHLRLMLREPAGKAVKAIAFGFGEWATRLKLGDRIDVAFEISVNEWNGNRELQARIVDLRQQS